ncbi:septum formation family protein [Cellulomonas sp. zg-ZUI188]|uniref:Septum formation family protein n=1 Tax=Cellulomonas fengjieae TaxID=2819978 RepID=A0ABS3SHB6_9CELL|nr:septum formation family protein [Cellulomonas fengjieae]MBO3100884.1 septum formation family protein [Cellulomonas fengjieae]QVI67747.1 septum formation family protein [Cellulomonas fengjieae]
MAGGVLGLVGTVALAVVGTAAVLTWRGTQPLPADLSAPRDAHAQQLVTGSCVQTLPADGSVGTVRVVPCADPHQAQVITEFLFAQDAVWPGQQAADARVARACVLDDTEVAAGVRTVTWAPTERSWADGDRVGLCLAFVDGQVTGSFLDGTVSQP